MLKKIIPIAVIAGIILFAAMQLVPYGRDHTNPSVTAEPKWDAPETRTLAKRACFDCHSNETVWPWYSNIAPSSWLVYADVAEGRNTYNFSNWDQRPERARGLTRVINESRMPPPQYLLIHQEARLAAAEKQKLADGIQKSIP